MKPKHKTGFRIDDEPEIMLPAIDLNNRLVGVPLVGVEVKRWNELQRNVVEERGEASTPVGDRGMRDRDIVQQTYHESNFAERVVAGKEHDNGRYDDVDRISHT